jgi:hypothetical protein
MNFGAISNSSHYNRNMSPQSGINGMVSGAVSQGVAPSSGGYMGQGLDMVGRLEQSGSEANSTSFYSNNTSAISNNLSNSRYLLNRRDTKLIGNVRLAGGNSVGKIIPGSNANGMTKSIDNTVAVIGVNNNLPVGYGSHTSNFSVNNNIYNNNNQNAIQHINHLN